MAKVKDLYLPPVLDQVIAKRQKELYRLTGDFPKKQDIIVDMLFENINSITQRTDELKQKRVKI